MNKQAQTSFDERIEYYSSYLRKQLSKPFKLKRDTSFAGSKDGLIEIGEIRREDVTRTVYYRGDSVIGCIGFIKEAKNAFEALKSRVGMGSLEDGEELEKVLNRFSIAHIVNREAYKKRDRTSITFRLNGGNRNFKGIYSLALPGVQCDYYLGLEDAITSFLSDLPEIIREKDAELGALNPNQNGQLLKRLY